MSPELEMVGEFLAEAVDVLREAVGIDALVDTTTDVPSPGGPHVIAVIVHVRGDLSGVTWSFPVEVARQAASRMVPGMELDLALCEAAASELANILTGRGLATLAAHGVNIEIEPPQISVATANGIGGSLGTEHGAIEVVFHDNGRAA